MYQNEEFVHQVGKKDFHYIRMHSQQKIEITKRHLHCGIRTHEDCSCVTLLMFIVWHLPTKNMIFMSLQFPVLDYLYC